MLAVGSLESPNVLTDWQNRVYTSIACPGLSKLRDLSQYSPVSAVADDQEDMDPEAREASRKLLGDISTPLCAIHGNTMRSPSDRGSTESTTS
jgi:hypothetical protein